MDTFDGAAPLSTTLVESLSRTKLDKDNFVRSFLQGQKPYANKFAVEGKKLLSTWNQNSPETRSLNPPFKTPPGQNQDFGFETPVLKPRVAQCPSSRGQEIPSKGKEKSPVKTRNSENKKLEKENSRLKAVKEATAVSPIAHTKGVSKRVHEAGSDDDRITRAAERRQRKRAKRTIMQGRDQQSEKEDIPSPARGERRKKEEGAKKKPSIPAGFALMHGFAATNVGKNRLTLKQVPNVGVFGKGKASAKTQVRNAKKHGQVNSYFSEFDFLNRNREELPQRKRKARSLDSEDVSAVSPPPVPKRNPAVKQDSNKHRPASLSSSYSSESEMHSIASKARKMKRQLSDPTFSPSRSKKCTAPRDRSTLSTKNGSAQSIIAPVIERPRSSPSLRPSQSASHRGGRNLISLAVASNAGAVSKYFPQSAKDRQLNATETREKARVTTDPSSSLPRHPVKEVPTRDDALPPKLANDIEQSGPVILEDAPTRLVVQATHSEAVRVSPKTHQDALSLVSSPNSLELALEEFELGALALLSMPNRAFQTRLHEYTGEDEDFGGRPVKLQEGFIETADEICGVNTWDSGLELCELDGYYEQGATEPLNWGGEPEDLGSQTYWDYDENIQDDGIFWSSDACDYQPDDIEILHNCGDPHEQLEEADLYDDGYNDMEGSDGREESRSSYRSSSPDYAIPTSEDVPICGSGQFSQGRSLLLGARGGPLGSQPHPKFTSVSGAEAIVAQRLKGHWLPHRP